MPKPPLDEKTKVRSRELRRESTEAERKLWRHLRDSGLGAKFRRQHPIGSFIVDFYCAAAKLVIEIDGESHADQVEYDSERTTWLEEQGYRVIRYTNRDVKDNLNAVIEDILERCKKNG